MTRALALTEKQTRTLIRAAKREHVAIEVKIGEVVVRLFPNDNAQAWNQVEEEEDIRL